MQSLADRGVSLIITVDCGITAAKETEFARSLEWTWSSPTTTNVRSSCPGCGGGGPQAQSRPENGHALAGWAWPSSWPAPLGNEAAMLEEYADLVAVGTVADVMP